MDFGYGEISMGWFYTRYLVMDRNHTDPESNVVLTEILWAYKELLVGNYAEERSPLASRRGVLMWMGAQ